MKKLLPLIFLLIFVVALGLRLPQLAKRPMHHDEANQAARFGILLETGEYQYDPEEHHGPTLYYLTLPIAWVTGADTFAETSEITYRILPVLFGMGLILLIPMLRSGIGCIAVLGAALLTAISPAMAYYSRFYIQEMLLVFFTFLALATGWLSCKGGSWRWAAVCGIALGLMFATKETAIIAYAAMFGAAVLCGIMERKIRVPLKHLALAAACAALIAFVLFSSFFTNLKGPWESIAAFGGYVSRGAGVDTDHVHPWNFYLKMLTRYRFAGGLVWSEGLILGLGIVGIVSILWKKIPGNCNLGLARFLMFYTLLLTLAYSIIPYKTPWCILSFLHGWIILAGIGVAAVLELAQQGRMPRLKYAAVLALLLLPVLSTARLAHRTVYRYAADYRNPYVYAHTSPDFVKLVQRIEEIAAINPDGRQMYIQVVAPPEETWPLPFYLRNYPNTGYWTEAGQLPGVPVPALLITSEAIAETMQEKLEGKYLSEYYGLRPDTLLSIHIRMDLWNAFIETRK
ncbi:MAG: TIGR03663 family protein [Kiritimatiellales bacterium]|nr:TIGR03663 family protein [Kiritimatiellales bacterium]